MQDISLETFLFAAMLTFLAGFATSIGAILAFFSKKDNYFILSIGMGFSAGVMIYVSFMEILVKSRESFTQLYENPITGELLTIICFFIGIILTAFIDKVIPEDLNPHEPKSDNQLQEQTRYKIFTNKKFKTKKNRNFHSNRNSDSQFPRRFCYICFSFGKPNSWYYNRICNSNSQYSRRNGSIFTNLSRNRREEKSILVCNTFRTS